MKAHVLDCLTQEFNTHFLTFWHNSISISIYSLHHRCPSFYLNLFFWVNPITSLLLIPIININFLEFVNKSIWFGRTYRVLTNINRVCLITYEKVYSSSLIFLYLIIWLIFYRWKINLKSKYNIYDIPCVYYFQESIEATYVILSFNIIRTWYTHTRTHMTYRQLLKNCE